MMEAHSKLIEALLDGKTTGEAHQIYIDCINEQIAELEKDVVDRDEGGNNE